jgi:hypothetical protein
MTNEQVIEAMEYVVKNGYSLKQNLGRTLFYMNKFTPENSNSTGDKIHKTIFTYITQSRMKKITRGENRKLRSKIS